MYLKHEWNVKGVREVERVYSGRYGKRTSPSERRAPTPEEMEQISTAVAVKIKNKENVNDSNLKYYI